MLGTCFDMLGTCYKNAIRNSECYLFMYKNSTCESQGLIIYLVIGQL